jgi:lysophospholipase L1-like esterase
MATWPTRGQQAPAYWDDQLRDYIDEPDTAAASRLDDLEDLTETGRLSADQQALDFAAKVTQTTVESGRLSEATLNANTDTRSEAVARRVLAPIDGINARLAASRRGPVSVVTLGSSTTSGNGASTARSRWVNQFAAAAQASYPSGVEQWEPPVRSLAAAAAALPTLPGVHVANGGISGATSANYYTGTTLTDINTLDPEIVIHMIGANDFALGSGAATLKANIQAAIDAIDAQVSDVIHVIADTYSRPDVVSASWGLYVNAMREAAEENANAVFVGTNDEWIAGGVDGYDAADPYRLTGWRIGAGGDIHPSDAGHALIASLIAKGLRLPPPRPVVPAEIFDRFQRAALGSAETAQPWEQQSGVHVPSGGYLTCTGAGNAVITSGFSDCEASCLLTVSGASVQGLIVKSNDSSTRIGAYFNGPSNRIEVYAGASLLGWATSGIGVGLTNGREYFLRLTVTGDQVRVEVNGQLALSVTLAGGTVTTYQNYLKHGVRCNTTDAVVKWRNLAVRRL